MRQRTARDLALVRRLDAAFRIVGWLAFAASAALATRWTLPYESLKWIPVRLLFLFAGLFGLFRVVATVRRLRASEAKPPDDAKDILYLRSFTTDNTIVKSRYHKTYETLLTDVLRDIAPVRAIAAPGSFLQSAGAFKEDVQPGKWREEVERKVQDARLVVLEPGLTAGVKWEMERVLHHRTRGCIIVTFLSWRALQASERVRRYDDFKRMIQTAGLSAPDILGSTIFMIIDGSDTPVVLTTAHAPWYLLGRWNVGTSSVREILRPALMKRGFALPRWKTALATASLLGLVAAALLPLLFALIMLS